MPEGFMSIEPKKTRAKADKVVKPFGETHAYSLEEITQMLNVLPEPAATIRSCL
jgi:hypothetical protein